MLDVSDALLHFIEDDPAPFDQQTAAFGQLDPARESIQEWCTQRLFHVGDCLGYRWLRQGQALRCLSHTASLRHSLQRVQIFEPQTPPDAIVPLHGLHPKL